MPELPEVETIARTLSPQIAGRRIESYSLLNPATLAGPLPLETVIGRRFGEAGRRGKLVLLPFEEATPPCSFPGDASDADSTGLAVHLKMTGRLFVYPKGTPPGKHTRLILTLNDGELFFDDSRKFGYVRVLSQRTLAAWDFWNTLGPEPLTLEPREFAACFEGRSGKIKSLLLDQTVLAGCGNIYADESLFRAHIRPDARQLTPSRLQDLHGALCEVLQESIESCGSSIRDYRTARGDAGSFQNKFKVYGRAGEQCSTCGALLESCRISGRATVFCPDCQKKELSTAECAPSCPKTKKKTSGEDTV